MFDPVAASDKLTVRCQNTCGMPVRQHYAINPQFQFSRIKAEFGEQLGTHLFPLSGTLSLSTR